MRTTLTLDEDVAIKIEEARERRNATLKEVVNEALRVGLRELEHPDRREDREGPYRTPSTSLGGCRLPDVDDVAGTLALAEGEGFR
ncbi:MAG: DUF2191 domain-containing protein [Gemmatimonadota bacterium]